MFFKTHLFNYKSCKTTFVIHTTTSQVTRLKKQVKK